MIIAKIEELLTKIQQLQSIMIAVSTDSYRNPIREKEKLYTKLYREIVDIIEFLAEEGVLIENHNPCKSLSDWRDRWSSLERGYALKGRYVHDLYTTSLSQIDLVLCQHYVEDKSHQQLVENWQISQFEDLIAKIKKLKGIMISVAIQGDPVYLIKSEDEDYRKLYRELTLQISILRQIGIPILHPNNFRSLWQWYHYWSMNLEKSYDVRERYIDDLYENILKPIERALKKYHLQSTSSEEFIQDLQRRFKQKISIQPIITTIVSTEFSDTLQEYTPNLEDYKQPEALENIPNSLSIERTQAVNNFLSTNIDFNLNWTPESVMNPEIFLEQNDVVYLENSLEKFFATKFDNASSWRSVFSSSGVEDSFIRPLIFINNPVEFSNRVVAKFKNYKVSNQRIDHHPMVKFLQYLLNRKESYEFEDQDIELFTKLAERGRENLNALKACNTVCRIESPKGMGIGTGVLIGKNLLLTCNHIFSKTQVRQAWIRFNYNAHSRQLDNNLFELDMTFLSYHNRPDYALVKIKDNPQQQKAIFINETSILDSGQDVRIIHHPQGNPVIISDFGQITQVGEDYIDHNVKTDDGSSGAPIFNRQWELIAIHQGNPGIGRTVIPGSTGGIPIRAIWPQISSYLN
ncbi:MULTISPECIES: trypsin-like peptidase domain-containing protein [unclassified Nostoc]|uniref:trypsin-like peptidase domain-containing protein n=1 Tax=unclassified Nostoc TaxID=2593658 RepID=UPI002AD57EBB|nr:trypsin-like peptidase domain-containing protein [Nostoc sp. DedQUE03]MDZ7973913.1 trypsin-like peptidase domain-containing protein [Nostoc sp. DedQUE03]MDZ8047456.1 trypsin-like peptidase domain-containing protein [Nostoc sp. DedQUE02]